MAVTGFYPVAHPSKVFLNDSFLHLP